MHLATGLPIVGNKILESTSEKTGPPSYSVLLKKARGQFCNVTGYPKVADLESLIESQRDGGIWFKRIVIVYLTNVFMHGNQSISIRWNILSCLENINAIRNFNWSDYMVEKLVDCTLK